MKKVTFLLLSMISVGAHAMTLAEIYQENFLTSETGVYNHDNSGLTFFIVRQECVEKKTYAGSKESKLAERTFHALLAQEVVSRSLSVSGDAFTFEGKLKTDVLNTIKSSFINRHTIKHQLLIDNNGTECVRNYVQVAETKQFTTNKLEVTKALVEKTAKPMLTRAIQTPALLAEYLDSFNVTDLAGLYRDHTRSVVEVPSYENSNVQKLKRFSAYDFNHSLQLAIYSKGQKKIVARSPNQPLADIYFERAQSNFSLGQNSKQIIEDLTMSVNAVPENVKYWVMLSSIFRAVSESNLALYTAQQAITLEPENIEMWVYWLKAQKQINQNQADSLKSILLIIGDETNLSPWALKQVKAI